jgi:hypothetical protein
MTYTIFYWIVNESNHNESCLIDGYCLRVEQIKKDVWWWCVYDDEGSEVSSSYSSKKWGSSIEEAKILSQNSYLSLMKTKV